MKPLRFGVILLALACTATAQDTAYKALRILATERGQSVLNKVVEVAGSRGTPQPAKWKITLDDPLARSGIREFEVAGGRIVSERAPARAYAGTARLMNFSKLNLDSDGAFTVANKQAVRSRVGFDSVDYVLQMDEDTDRPTWALRLLTRRGRHAGTLFIAADTGGITRTSGMAGVAGTGENVARQGPPPRSGEPEIEPRDTDHGGGFTGKLGRFRDRVKRHFVRDGAAMQEFFTGRRTIDREYRDDQPDYESQDNVAPPRNY